MIVASVPEPPRAPGPADGSGHLLREAWAGLRYATSNRTIRGIAASLSILNIGGGIVTIVVPLLVLQRLGLPEAVVGGVFAVQGIAGVIFSHQLELDCLAVNRKTCCVNFLNS